MGVVKDITVANHGAYTDGTSLTNHRRVDFCIFLDLGSWSDQRAGAKFAGPMWNNSRFDIKVKFHSTVLKIPYCLWEGTCFPLNAHTCGPRGDYHLEPTGMSIAKECLCYVQLFSTHKTADVMPLPDWFVAFCIFYPSSISILNHVTINILHQQIRCKNAMDKVPPDVQVIKVVLKEGWNLITGFESDSRRRESKIPLRSKYQCHNL